MCFKFVDGFKPYIQEQTIFAEQLILESDKILTIQSGYCPLSERAVLVHLLVGRRIEAAAPEGPYSSAASLLAARSAWNTHTKHTRIITYKTNSLKRVNVRESKLEWSTFLLEGPFFLFPPHFPLKSTTESLEMTPVVAQSKKPKYSDSCYAC